MTAVDPTDPQREREMGRVALWLAPDDLRRLAEHCCCGPETSDEDRDRCGRVRFRARAALHKQGLTD